MVSRMKSPYGAWRSPVTAELVADGATGIMEPLMDAYGIYYLESRPTEGGRQVIVRIAPDGSRTDVNHAPYNARTRVHEYGGGAYTVHAGNVFFSHFGDGRLYRVRPGEAARPVTPDKAWRYADFVYDEKRARLICVREDHTVAGEPANTLVAVGLSGTGDVTVLARGHDFYSNPRVHPRGDRLAWLAWDHPNMPWDGTVLYVADIRPDGTLGAAEKVAGGPRESLFQPEWGPDGALHFISDRSGWWNLYRHVSGQTVSLWPSELEFGRPQWVFGQSTYGFAAKDRIVCAFCRKGEWRLAVLDARTGARGEIDVPFRDIEYLRVKDGAAVFVGGGPAIAKSLVRLDLDTGGYDILRHSLGMTIDEGFLSMPEAIEFPTDAGLTAHAFFYPPANRDWQAPADEKPPLIVMSHGGPTSAASTTLSPGVQFWTSRGFAVVDVNYGGSTGYGTAYRRRLNGLWGVVDVADCTNAALHLARLGRVDERRLLIRGKSAGGYTTLACLTFRDVFAAGASYYGIGDMEALARDTHKFESRYCDSMIGPYPERRDVYAERSPIHFTGRLRRPVIFFQGRDDKVVPPDQTMRMAEALRARGGPVACLVFEGEGHGFRDAGNVRRALEAELYFYGRIFGFAPAGVSGEPVRIENLD